MFSGKSLCRMDFFVFGVESSVAFTSKTLLVLSFSSWCMHGSRRCTGASHLKKEHPLCKPYTIIGHESSQNMGLLPSIAKHLFFSVVPLLDEIVSVESLWHSCRHLLPQLSESGHLSSWQYAQSRCCHSPPPPSNAEFLLSLECAVPGAQFVSTMCVLRMSSSPRGRWRHVASPLFPFAVDFEWEPVQRHWLTDSDPDGLSDAPSEQILEGVCAFMFLEGCNPQLFLCPLRAFRSHKQVFSPTPPRNRKRLPL